MSRAGQARAAGSSAQAYVPGGSGRNPQVGPTDTPYARFTLILLERLAIGDVVFLTDGEIKSFGATGHLSEADAAGCRTGRGFMPATTFRAIAKSAGLAGVGNMAVIPVGARHLISKKHLKVLTTELGERRKEHRGEARNLEIIQKRQNDAIAVEKQIADKAAKDAAKKAGKLEKEQTKQALRQDRAASKEAKKQPRAASSEQKSKPKPPPAAEPEQLATRRQTMENALVLGARAASQLDMQEAKARWVKHPEHTRYRATKAVQTREEGYLSFDHGDLITVTDKADNGYYTGTLARTGEQGIFIGRVVEFVGSE
eukprot:m.150487 g.150487  ORF g.150487 m.150487 type:complete len:314 (+) comp23305_c0_seq1:519-1460(+)